MIFAAFVATSLCVITSTAGVRIKQTDCTHGFDEKNNGRRPSSLPHNYTRLGHGSSTKLNGGAHRFDRCRLVILNSLACIRSNRLRAPATCSDRRQYNTTLDGRAVSSGAFALGLLAVKSEIVLRQSATDDATMGVWWKRRHGKRPERRQIENEDVWACWAYLTIQRIIQTFSPTRAPLLG